MNYGEDFTLPVELLEQVKEQGLDVLPELIHTVLNTAMQARTHEIPGKSRIIFHSRIFAIIETD